MDTRGYDKVEPYTLVLRLQFLPVASTQGDVCTGHILHGTDFLPETLSLQDQDNTPRSRGFLLPMTGTLMAPV